jgi:heat shock protein HtpX
MREVDLKKARRAILLCGLRSALCFVLMFCWLAFLIWLSAEFLHAQLIIVAVLGTVSFCALSFFFSEFIIIVLMKAKRPKPVEYPEFIRAVHEIWKGKRMLPRLYILEMKGPNACAFGIGFLGQYAIGITQELYDMLTYEELCGVLAHETGHIRTKDVGLMSAFSIAMGSIRALQQLLGTSVLSATPVAMVLNSILWLFGSILLPIIIGAASQEREYAADAYAEIWLGTPDPLISALRKLEEWKDPEGKKKKKKGPAREKVLDQLVISHPGTDFRVAEMLKNCKDLPEMAEEKEEVV